jgi:hypothetical protein
MGLRAADISGDRQEFAANPSRLAARRVKISGGVKDPGESGYGTDIVGPFTARW